MPPNIKDVETHALAKRLATLQGQSIAAAVKQAVKAELSRIERRDLAKRAARRQAIEGIVQECATLPVLDDRSADEILGYDDKGLPT
ncbi:MAG: type II toxin-antitoxin system VapB family antitoxin [Alphaproteobacteria bacterium]|nr:type II toxin-antitoxin system VapB family antitoxin [Alphaproteobacteria bacterium]